MNDSENNQQRQRGFTSLIEIITVMIIIGVLTIVTFPNIRRGEQRQTLRQAALQMAQDFRNVQDRSIASRALPSGRECPTGGPNSITIPPNGYGLAFDRNDVGDTQYLLFANCFDSPPNEPRYDANPGNPSQDESVIMTPTGTNRFVRTLPSGIVNDFMQIQDQNGNAISGNRVRVDVTYVPPHADVRILGGNDDVGSQLIVRLRLQNGSCPQDCTTVRVTTTGFVDIE